MIYKETTVNYSVNFAFIESFSFSVDLRPTVNTENMPFIFNVDHKVLAMTTLAATASVAAYSLYRLHTLKRKLASREDVYETAKFLNEYLIFHYGSPDEVLPFSSGPKSDVGFPARCAELCIKHAVAKVLRANNNDGDCVS